jgi:hypothetical protein
MSTPLSKLGLLLADPADLRPMLADGLPDEATGSAPRPKKAPRGIDAFSLDAPDADPNELPLQRWGVIVPPGPEGDRALDAIAPLVRLREAEQGARAKIYRNAPVGGGLEEAAAWKTEVWQREEESERPRYLLILGEADQCTFEFQHALTNGAFVGRLHADSLDGYAAYAAKVVQWARKPSTSSLADALFHVTDDGTDATSMGRTYLVDPCADMARSALGRRRFPLGDIVELPQVEGVSDFLAGADRARPSVLLSVSHGLGGPGGAWGSVDQQRALQGALIVTGDESQGKDRLLTADRIARARFLPGGLWFCVACFGAGTPDRSVFYPWLAELRKVGAYRGRLDRVLESLPVEGSPPFLAAMPKAALANPEGPLAIVGHIDLAWTFSFTSSDLNRPTQGRAGRIFSSMQAMTRGSRAGVALDALMRSYREVNDELTAGYQAEEDARVWNRPSPIDPRRRGAAFMLRNDLRGYVLLGDPAVRLPLEGSGAREVPVAREEAVIVPPIARSLAAGPARDPMEMERAVHAMIRGDEAPRAIAARHGISRADLDAWVERYCAGGREALAKGN